MTTTLVAFALAATLLILAPGPDSMLVLRNTLRGGRHAGWLATLAWLAARGVRWLSRPGRRRWLERATGIVLIGFGVRLALTSR
jgi:threonine/homoserine/homoserine lactone efflux protein